MPAITSNYWRPRLNVTPPLHSLSCRLRPNRCSVIKQQSVDGRRVSFRFSSPVTLYIVAATSEFISHCAELLIDDLGWCIVDVMTRDNVLHGHESSDQELRFENWIA